MLPETERPAGCLVFVLYAMAFLAVEFATVAVFRGSMHPRGEISANLLIYVIFPLGAVGVGALLTRRRRLASVAIAGAVIILMLAEFFRL
jgi:hypothetical protein